MKSYALLYLNALLAIPAFLTDHFFEVVSCFCLVVTTGFAAFKYYHEAKKAEAETDKLTN